MKRSIAIIGEYNPTFPPHVSTNEAIEHSRSASGISVDGIWVSTEEINKTLFEHFSGIWVAPGSPYKKMAQALWAIRYARENGIACFGTCGGFQHMIIEYALNVLGFRDVGHAEYDPYASNLFITQLACSLAGREMELTFSSGSKVAEIYGATSAIERYYCNFGVNPDYVSHLKSGSLKITGSDSDGEIRVIELPDHPFFLGTLFVPQARSTADQPHPLVTAFLKAVQENRSVVTHNSFDARMVRSIRESFAIKKIPEEEYERLT
jgi:CTP synthase (UTP-ammonia lyase)